MENAAKALLIAAGVMIGIMLLFVMIFMFRQGARVNQTYDQKQITNQLELYNSQFEYYDKSNNNIMDVISLANLAFDVNMETNYDDSNAVEIEIQIGPTTFKLPNTYCGFCSNNSNLNLKNNKCKSCGKDLFTKRNYIIKGNSLMSIYNLADKSLKDLGINTGIKQKKDILKLEPTESTNSVSVDVENDTLSTTKYKNGKTVYKYLFAVVKPEDFSYYDVNMKVSKIKLTAYCNPNWNDT